MTTYTNAIVTIKSIVEGMFLKSELPEGFKAKMKQIVIDGYREMNIVTLPQGNEVAKFTMDSNYIIYLPDDVILVNSVSVPLDGEFWPLTLDNNMISTTSQDNGQEVLDSDTWGEGDDILKRGLYYAARGGVNVYGYYYPDMVKRRILCRNVDRSEVFVDYMTSGINLKEPTYIPIYAKAAIEAYVRLYLEYNKLIPNPNTIAIYRDEFERQKAICRGIKFNMVDFLDAIYRTYSASVDR